MGLKFFELMLNRNVYFHDYGGKLCHHGFSMQHTNSDIDEVLEKAQDVVKEMVRLF